MSKSIHNPHDHFFRQAMSNVRVAREFFIQHLPSSKLQQIDLDSLQFRKESFIDEELKASSADVVYSANIKGKIGFLYILVEHQSSVDQWICFRLLCYMVRIMQFHHAQYPKDPLPAIYPLIFYNGVTKYTSSTDLFELFGEQKNLVKEIFNEPFQLIDTQKIEDEELRQYQWVGILEFVLKHRFTRDFLIFADQMMLWLHQLESEESGYDYVRTVLKYVVNGLEGRDAEVLVNVAKQHLSPQLGGETMTFAEQLIQKGYKKGFEEGAQLVQPQLVQQRMQQGKQQTIRQIVKRLLDMGMSSEMIARATGLTTPEIEQLHIMEVNE